MTKKSAKSTRKFAASGQLKKQIQARRKHQQIKRKIQHKKGSKGKEHLNDDQAEGEEDEGQATKLKGMSVDDFLGASFMDEDDDGSLANASDVDDEDEEEGEDNDDQSFASIDDLEGMSLACPLNFTELISVHQDEGAAHMQELSKLAEKDPDFYNYLQENDRELLEFNANAVDGNSDEDEEDENVMQEDRSPVLTKRVLQKWQKALLETQSLRALRKLFIAFRSAAHMNEEDQVLAWTIDSSSVYNKLVTTALRYTPIILEHHAPYKILANGKIKAPAQTQKLKTLQKMILSYFHNVTHITSQLTEPELIKLAISESAKLLPYVVSSRKAVKQYLKTCLDLWSTADDSLRIAAFLAIRKLASATDESILDMVLKGVYLSLMRSAKSTNTYTLPSINLMKNSASEIFCLDHTAAYQHAFGYIRQLAINLRNGMKMKTKESFQQVYNWQYVHSIDFWAHVLARACDVQATAQKGGKESALKPLIYPLVQVATGAIKLIPNSRSYPFHLHIIRSLIHLSQHSHTYIPLAPHLLPILTSTLTASKPKSSTLRPLDFETNIRAPQQYIHTRVYNEGIADEGAFLLAEWLTTPAVQGSIAFPELVVPLTVVLRKALKTSRIDQKSRGGKEAGIVKGLVERIEESAKWVEQKRDGVSFAPAKMAEVDTWEAGVKVEETPLGKYIKVQRKTREKRRKLVEKVRETDFRPYSRSRHPSGSVAQGKVRMRSWKIRTFVQSLAWLGMAGTIAEVITVSPIRERMALPADGYDVLGPGILASVTPHWQRALPIRSSEFSLFGIIILDWMFRGIEAGGAPRVNSFEHGHCAADQGHLNRAGHYGFTSIEAGPYGHLRQLGKGPLFNRFKNILTGTQGFVGRDDQRKEIVVAFRGSQDLEDFLLDGNLFLVPFASPGILLNSSEPVDAHAGFLSGYNSVAQTVLSEVKSQLNKHKGYSIILTGHSLGGALASIASVSIKSNLPIAGVRLFTFGAVLFAFFIVAQLLRGAQDNRERATKAVHTFDGVPTMVPESLGYRHQYAVALVKESFGSSKNLVISLPFSLKYRTIDSSSSADPSTVVLCQGPEDPSCSDSIPSSGINLAHAVYFGQIMTTDATLCL
ncbi:hypothetical protein EW146_g3186 [Bondarzewia mesenterica]|uniref:Fungal lipase-type domain-containing protein n=1 Tax=Bondarzewia mesenterica TaxID=1095465 RepID=A0A4S4M061_9AGAM|nr:hypothetical protein EW146_g3186 [Bondarzewia mesenterica]